ncbi:MAG TPA: hypothetical protein VJV79_12125, partial [Polyangiaceae bacterium]|nr:hypothetical protein [Polyangiaceae bacterium]
ATPAPSIAPALADSAQLAAPISSARAPQPTVGSAASRVAPPRAAGRADERGLAKDNPFK